MLSKYSTTCPKLLPFCRKTPQTKERPHKATNSNQPHTAQSRDRLGEGPRCNVPALPLTLIHRSTWKRILRTSLVECSPKFRSTSVHTPRSAPVLWRCVYSCVFLCVHEHHFTGHASSPPAATATQSPFGPAAAPYKAGRERNPTSGRPV